MLFLLFLVVLYTLERIVLYRVLVISFNLQYDISSHVFRSVFFL